MFRSFVYLDEEKMYSYLRQIDKDYANRPEEISTKKAKGGNFGPTAFSLNIGTEVEERKRYNKDLFNDYDRFEKDLESLEGDEYYDFVLNPDYDYNTVPKMSILRISGKLEIPEQFDMYSIAQGYMPLITSQIQT